MKRVIRTIGKNFGVKAVRKRYRKVQALKAVEWVNTDLLILERDHMQMPALTIFTEKEILYYRMVFVARQSREQFIEAQKKTKSQGERP